MPSAGIFRRRPLPRQRRRGRRISALGGRQAVAPTIRSNGGGDTADVSITAGTTAITTVTTTGDGPITFSITGGPPEIQIDGGSGVASFSGPAAVGVYVFDANATGPGGTDTQTITVTVTGSGPAPAVLTHNRRRSGS